MQYNIKSVGDELTITVINAKSVKDELLTSFVNCQRGQCGCPTKEYRKLAELNVSPKGEDIELKMKPMKGEKFNISEIEKCLDYTISEVNKKEE